MVGAKKSGLGESGNLPQSAVGETLPSDPSSGKLVKRRKKRATALSPERFDPTWQMLDKRIGGRKGLLGAALSSTSPKAAILAELLLDPAFGRAGTKALARKAGMSAPEIVDLFRDRKMLETILALHDGLPEVVQGAVDDAKPRQEPCAECKASGKNEHGDNCWVCGGVGTVRKAGDKDKLSFVGNAAKLTEKGGFNVNFNQQINAGQANIHSSFEDMIRRATLDQKKITEGTVIEDDNTK